MTTFVFIVGVLLGFASAAGILYLVARHAPLDFDQFVAWLRAK